MWYSYGSNMAVVYFWDQLTRLWEPFSFVVIICNSATCLVQKEWINWSWQASPLAHAKPLSATQMVVRVRVNICSENWLKKAATNGIQFTLSLWCKACCMPPSQTVSVRRWWTDRTIKCPNYSASESDFCNHTVFSRFSFWNRIYWVVQHAWTFKIWTLPKWYRGP